MPSETKQHEVRRQRSGIVAAALFFDTASWLGVLALSQQVPQ